MAKKSSSKSASKPSTAKKATIESRSLKAVAALQKYLENAEESSKSQLFDPEAKPIYLSITGKKYFSEKKGIRPRLISVPHPVYGKAPLKTCIFVKDPQRSYKNIFQPEEGDAIVDRVVGVSKLKGKFKPFEARRALKADYDVFLAEEDVFGMLPALLGKSFFGSQNSVPVPIRITNKEKKICAVRTEKQVAKVLGSTVFIVPGSTRASIRVGTTDQEPRQVAENVAAVVKWLEEHGNDAENPEENFAQNFRTVVIKTEDSPALPVLESEQIYSENDIGEEQPIKLESEKTKRKREMAALDELLAEVVDTEEIKEWNLKEKRRRANGGASATGGAVGEEEHKAQKGQETHIAKAVEEEDEEDDFEGSESDSDAASDDASDSGSESLDESE